jgi:hypothetical protein
MTIISQQPIQQEQIKLRWQEPYVSAALNNKSYRTLPRGVYRGFIVEPGPGALQIKVTTGGPSGSLGYQEGNYDPAGYTGWSIAVHENYDGYNATVIMQNGVNSDYVFDMTTLAGTTVYVVLDVAYIQGFPTSGQIVVADSSELNANPTLLVLAKVEIPPSGPITAPNITTNDALFPRPLPFANPFKMGYMSPIQAEELEILTSNTASPAFEVEYIVVSDGPQVVTIPGGNIYTVGGYDLFIFKNGLRMTRGRDYTEIDRGDGKGQQVTWISTTLRIDDRILFRGQEYAVSLNNDLAVLDEGTTISGNVTRINFVGNGVLVLPEGPGRVRVTVPTAGTGGSSTKDKLNSSGASIPMGRAVYLKSDGSIDLCDPRTRTHVPFGVTSGAIPDGSYGTVVVSGVAVNALIGLGGISTGQSLFVSGSGDGTLVIIPPSPATADVFRIGLADCPDGTSSGSPADVIVQIQQMI